LRLAGLKGAIPVQNLLEKFFIIIGAIILIAIFLGLIRDFAGL